MLDSLNRGLEIMKYIAMNHSASVSEIATVFEINKSTASRILTVLANHNLVYKDKRTMKYYSDLGGLAFGAKTLSDYEILDAVHPILRAIADTLNITAQFSILKKNQVVLLDQVKSKSNKYVKEPGFPGMAEPLHCTALGKCALAFMSEENIEAILINYQFTKYTDQTIMDAERLQNELQKIRKNGYATDMAEYSDKVFCIAVPIFDKRGKAIYGLGVSGTKKYLENEEYCNLVKIKLQKFSKQIVGSIYRC